MKEKESFPSHLRFLWRIFTMTFLAVVSRCSQDTATKKKSKDQKRAATPINRSIKKSAHQLINQRLVPSIMGQLLLLFTDFSMKFLLLILTWYINIECDWIELLFDYKKIKLNWIIMLYLNDETDNNVWTFSMLDRPMQCTWRVSLRQ